MIKEYVCKFEALGRKEELVFEIVNNELTRDWAHQVEYYFNKGEKYPLDLVNVYGENKKEVFLEMKSIAQEIGLEYNYTFENFTQESLNRLHEEFHFKEEQNNQDNKDLYHRLNILIHKIEGNDKVCYWYTHKVLDYEQPIKDNHWQYFDIKTKTLAIDRPFLSLGYHTIGKDLRHCFLDNDIELVKKNGIRPIQRLHTQVFYRESDSLVNNKKNIRKWAKKNKIYHLIDWSKPQYSKNQRFPLLGYLKGKTACEAEILWTHWTFKEIDIN